MFVCPGPAVRGLQGAPDSGGSGGGAAVSDGSGAKPWGAGKREKGPGVLSHPDPTALSGPSPRQAEAGGARRDAACASAGFEEAGAALRPLGAVASELEVPKADQPVEGPGKLLYRKRVPLIWPRVLISHLKTVYGPAFWAAPGGKIQA